MGIIEDAIQAADLIEDRIGRAAEAAEKAQEATRALRETLADTQQAKRDLEALEARVADLVRSSVGDLITENAESLIKTLGDATEEQMRKSVAKVISEFDSLRGIMLGQEQGDGKKSIPEMLEDMKTAMGLEWAVFMATVRAAKAVSNGCSDEACTREPEYAVLAMIDLPDGSRGESHFHLCSKHKEQMKKDATVLKTFRLETKMCPWPHARPQLVNMPDEDDS